jgi:hypothetical protein
VGWPAAEDEQAHHHCGRILLGAGAALIDLGAAHIDLRHRVHDEMHQMILGQPVAQIRRQEQRGVVVDVDEACWQRRL